MPEIPTVEIHSWKDNTQKWVINASDYDPAKHTMWGMVEPVAKPVVEHVPLMRPSVPDFIHDEDGNIVTVNIIDPDRRTARKEIPYGEFDPDRHQLWSEHPRFQ